MSTHHASCQCRALKVRLEGEPDYVGVCNCRACQRRTGSVFGTGAYFLKTALTVEGEVKTWDRDTETGHNLINHFCPHCGTNLFWTFDIRPTHVGVAYGSFETELPKPDLAIWAEEKHDWVIFPDDWTVKPRGR